MNKVIVIFGPTASGKSALAVEIAKHFGGEVISCDSMQIYKGMDIATAKPTEAEMQGIRHHLVDFLPIEETYSVARFKSDAVSCIDDIISRGKLPIVCGGTGLYVDALINNTVFLDGEDALPVRRLLAERAETEGVESLLAELQNIDSQTAEKLSLSDSRRIIRALELYYTTGKTKTEQNEQSRTVPSQFEFLLIGLNAEKRSVLYDRINCRVDAMIANGLVEEAMTYFSTPHSLTAAQAIGYKELKSFFNSEAQFDDCVEHLKAVTRHYAKRQLTWFRRYENVNWLLIDKDENLVSSAKNIITQWLENSEDGSE